MNTRTKFAFLGGLAGVVGTPLIGFFESLLWNLLAFLTDSPAQPFRWDLWFSGSWLSILRRDLASFISGFVAVLLIIPLALRRIDSVANSVLRFPRIGTLFGALAGFVCCVLLAFVRLSTDFVWPTLFRDGIGALPTVLRYYTTYIPIAAIMSGPSAACLGGLIGAILEWYWRRSSTRQ